MSFTRIRILEASVVLAIFGCFLYVAASTQSKVSPRHSEADTKRMQASLAALHQHLVDVRTIAAAGPLAKSESAYKKLFADPRFGRSPGLCMEYAALLDGEGKPQEAMKQIAPLVFQGHNQSSFDAVVAYEADLRKTQGAEAVKKFRDQIRDRSGYSLRDYNNLGLSDEEVIPFIEGRKAEGRHDWAGAERHFRQILRDYPPSPEFYAHMRNVLCAQHLQKEVIPLFEDWYRHSNPSMRQRIRRTYSLDFKRLDVEIATTRRR